MGIFGKIKTEIRAEVATDLIVAKTSYGGRFWTLLLAIGIAVSAIFHMEQSRARPVVERIPAAELSAYIK